MSSNASSWAGPSSFASYPVRSWLFPVAAASFLPFFWLLSSFNFLPCYGPLSVCPCTCPSCRCVFGFYVCVCVCVCLLVSVCIFEQIKWNYIFLCDALNVICIRILQATIFTNECSPVPFAWSLVLGPWGLGPLENQTSGCWTNHLNCPTSQQTNRPAELTTFAKILSYPFQPSLRALKVPFCHWVLFLLLPLLLALIPPAVICICLSSFPLTGINICFRLIIFFCCLLFF